MSTGWKENLDALIDQESGAAWRPFPQHYVDTRYHGDTEIPQITLTNPSVHVICKRTDDFATMQQFEVDEESLPPKVLCWNAQAFVCIFHIRLPPIPAAFRFSSVRSPNRCPPFGS